MPPIVPEGVSAEQRLVCSIIPPLKPDRHKGQAGRLGVLGGSADYTGAPYFAAMAALRTGADMVHVFCPSAAATAIKSYSPELMVHPLLDAKDAVAEMCQRLPRLHSLVIGPGLGLSESVSFLLPGVLEKVRNLELPVVLDADGLFYVTQNPDLVRGYARAILTPNVVELDRLYRAVLGSAPATQDIETKVAELARALGHVTVLAKGAEDIISDGRDCLRCKEQGSPRRCGGQGDLLAGSVATFAYWSHDALRGTPGDGHCLKLEYSPSVVAALGGAMLARRCSRLAFQKMARSTLVSDMIAEIRAAFSMLFPVD